MSSLGDLMRESEQAQQLADSLLDNSIPPLLMPASQGDPLDLGHFAMGWAVIYTYPGGSHSPDGGEDSPMLDAAQHRAYGAHAPDMSALRLAVVGVSSQLPDAQRESAEASRVLHRLLSDPHLLLADALGLPTFTRDGARCYRRLTMVVRHGRIGKVFYPVERPARSAAQVIAWAKAQGV